MYSYISEFIHSIVNVTSFVVVLHCWKKMECLWIKPYVAYTDQKSNVWHLSRYTKGTPLIIETRKEIGEEGGWLRNIFKLSVAMISAVHDITGSPNSVWGKGNKCNLENIFLTKISFQEPKLIAIVGCFLPVCCLCRFNTNWAVNSYSGVNRKTFSHTNH